MDAHGADGLPSHRGFQSGLSWGTILAKSENFRAAFAGFDFRGVANFDDNDIERLLADEGIVRYRGKIEAVINNARRTFEVVQEEGSFAAFIDHVPIGGVAQGWPAGFRRAELVSPSARQAG